MSVRFAVISSGSATTLVAAAGGKVVASFLPGPKPQALLRRLRERFPDAEEAPESEVAGAGAMRRWLEGDPSALA